MLVHCCKLREWVWTKTGKGDRLGGDSRVGPSPFLDRPAPPHCLHRTSRTRPEAGHLHMPACCAVFAGPHLPCHALFACLCLDHMPVALGCIAPMSPSNHVRQDHLQCFARTALQAAHTTGTALCSPYLFVFCIHPFPCARDFLTHTNC